MLDFTEKTYISLLNTLLRLGFNFQTFAEFLKKPESKKVVILRHDVDRYPINALKLAELENKFNIKATYYFRIIPPVFNPEIIKKIKSLGHEIGYHYEDLYLTKGNISEAYISFCKNLKKIRSYYPVETICMHGSPLSKWDSRLIWNEYDYHALGIIGEPYFDIDYHEVFYITDTGRKWNNKSISIRDKVDSGFDIPIKNTGHLIELIKNDHLPHRIMMNIHPHRWFEYGFYWYRELIFQNLKNMIKISLLLFRK